ncbi:hypothetical protein TEA_005469 [Camellia sinensis var. sinensis]|uniref:Uncharacterized protein n=1 Tax=Camellia sinensis var. sinensis TaxID=542762 RepID=A0A4S4E919_CAMSN|nr:hypothetical protein TEA_005469 [Camellia sinensis var. sinensis]
MPIEGIFVSGFVNLLFGKMTSFASSKLPTFEGIDTQLTNWTNMLSQIEAFLIDAEEKQLTDRAVNLWLDDLEDLAYDLDDLVDEFATEALQHKLKAKPPQASSSKVWNLIPHFKPRDVMFNFKMKSKIEEINTRLHNSFQQCSKLNLVKISVGTTSLETRPTRESASLPKGPIYGREKDQRKIVELLLGRDESSRNHPELCLSGLQNVVVPLDSREANLNDKEGLDVLSMEWSVNSDDSRDGTVKTEVLDMLQPHKNLTELHIKGYLGTGFPTWIGDPLFSNMAYVSLENCENCASLPPLGQLASLKKLYIKRMSVLKHVGREFYGQGGAKPFQLLETLSFKDMPEWEYWYTFEDDKEVQPFTHVSELSIENCPNLVGMLPSDLPCLNNLEIRDSPKLCGVMPKDLHYLNNLEISECPQFLVESSSNSLLSLTSIAMDDVPLTSLEAVLEMRSMVDEEVISANAKSKHPSSITSLSIGMIKKLELLPKWVTHGLMEVEELKIRRCEKLKTLWKNEARVQQSFPAFRRLNIEDCPQLVSLFEENEDEENEGQHQQQQQEGLSCKVRLEHLTIYNCEKLEKLPRLLHTFTFLQELYVSVCPSLCSFPETGFPCTLKTLHISYCEALQSLFGWITQINDNNLEVLCVQDCPSLTCLISCRGGGLPPTLKELWIRQCKKLEALLVEEGMEINCPSLESVWIWCCDRLKYLPDALPNNNNLRNLSRLYFYGCKNLEYIPEGWLHSATNLRELNIMGCKKLKALPHGLQSINYLTSLEELEMDISQWNNNFKKIGLHSLSSLKKLLISGEEEEEEHPVGSSFPIDGKLLPTSLIYLRIHFFRNLEKLSSKLFQNLASLECLRIGDCPRLKSLPVQRLPPSLNQLWISICPRLTGKCEKGKGKYWPHLAHIPDVNIN